MALCSKIMRAVWKKNKSQAALFKKIIYYRNKNLKKLLTDIIKYFFQHHIFMLKRLQHNKNKQIVEVILSGGGQIFLVLAFSVIHPPVSCYIYLKKHKQIKPEPQN